MTKKEYDQLNRKNEDTQTQLEDNIASIHEVIKKLREENNKIFYDFNALVRANDEKVAKTNRLMMDIENTFQDHNQRFKICLDEQTKLHATLEHQTMIAHNHIKELETLIDRHNERIDLNIRRINDLGSQVMEFEHKVV